MNLKCGKIYWADFSPEKSGEDRALVQVMLIATFDNGLSLVSTAINGEPKILAIDTTRLNEHRRPEILPFISPKACKPPFDGQMLLKFEDGHYAVAKYDSANGFDIDHPESVAGWLPLEAICDAGIAEF